ncbi:alpha-(1-_3)-arabinofuranosyltransferase domain-containing protein [Corynebacterium epidermidicanis]|uniref:Putative DUF3367 family protein n=1 Tax=Corynebacterium epidermidicanis TaxID=1050174 RepID=A0A0G3GSQ7_9CORY|nr:alpha-(1->3)-arabinofuranosyltransferase family protein [Corynebacterium epidermidicanis]AKK04124.1 putative DUF3367 family protein [Corynebacterium epidermidicanis]
MRDRHAHLVGWLFLAALCFLQAPGLVFADTKHDLTANPAGFLRHSLHAWTDLFPLGQLQNQAYGYLFPQGLFFLLASPFPDWLAQRAWWTLVLGIGFSGFFILTRRLSASLPAAALGAILYALSPHTLSTLGAISSETWPMMLTPWVLAPLVSKNKPGTAAVAASLLAVAMMGAVNAVATAAACLPALVIFLVWRAWRSGIIWVLGCAAVSAWWLGPLLVLGAYSPPFTDFIESSYVTTRWLSLPEILRGATSWAPFADSERIAGTLLATNPYFVLATSAIAILGLVGLTRADLPLRRAWVLMFLLGVGILGAAHGPAGHFVLELLDGPLAPLRNLHKFDTLVRVPLLLGFTHLLTHIRAPQSPRRAAAFACIVLVACASIAPAWSGRLGPRGGFTQVPDYWVEAASWLNSNARSTRTMVLPATSFARQTWGWTRDEPLQPLLEVPWVVRDAVPLVPPEAIRSLDGIVAHPTPEAMERLGVGIVVIRHDLSPHIDTTALEQAFSNQGFSTHTFGEVSIIELDRNRGMSLSSTPPVRVAGSGESLALIDALFGPHSYELTASGAADIVTDTPLLTTRNYGLVTRAESAPLAKASEGADVRNAVPNYPSHVEPIPVTERGGHVVVSSAASAATAFLGPDPSRSATAAVDKHPETAWYPAPGKQQGEWLELRPDQLIDRPEVTFTTTGAPVVVTISGGGAELNRTAYPHRPVTVQLPADRVDSVRLTLGASATPAGLAEVHLTDHPIERIISLPARSGASAWVMQRLTPDTRLIQREFGVAEDASVLVDAATCHEDAATPGPVATDIVLDGHPVQCGDTQELSAGTHRITTTSRWISLHKPDLQLPPPPTTIADEVPRSEKPQLLNSHRATNPGLRASVGGVPVAPIDVDAAAQGFLIPAGVSGRIELSFAGDSAYRWSLFAGAGVAVLVVLACLVLQRRPRDATPALPPERVPTWCWGAATVFLVAGFPGLLAMVATAAIRRWTIFDRGVLAAAGMALAGMWLAHAPWPSENYAGDQWFSALAGVVSLSAIVLPDVPRIHKTQPQSE